MNEISLFVGFADDMHHLSTESVDLIVTSPPYNIQKSNWRMGGHGKRNQPVLKGRKNRPDSVGYDLHKAMPECDYQDWQIKCLNEMYRVARPGASLFYNHKVRNKHNRATFPLEWLLRDDNLWMLRQEIIWDRTSTHNHERTYFWPHDERIYWMTRGKPKIYSRTIGMPTVWRFHGPKPGTWHPAPFDEELPRRCMQAIGGENLVVLDPFAGSCVTLKAATEFGHRAVGYDISRNYLERACKEYGWGKVAINN